MLPSSNPNYPLGPPKQFGQEPKRRVYSWKIRSLIMVLYLTFGDFLLFLKNRAATVLATASVTKKPDDPNLKVNALMVILMITPAQGGWGFVVRDTDGQVVEADAGMEAYRTALFYASEVGRGVLP
ncbi:Os12g0406333 [Oryza sativa Japonica Group]|uniref:Os12g0406333 protein n=1 Tax=Oryza sativa subsp. japonica TaxID=39947 RepID=A0A0P0Y9N8_ORYSJ|nr:Os12g0406333 [Oryza sativa Japonica Group]